MKKTLQEFYEEVRKSDELKKALAEAVKSGKVTDFLKANGCEATKEELKEFVAERAAKDKPVQLSDEELEQVAGGTDGPIPHSYACSAACSAFCC